MLMTLSSIKHHVRFRPSKPSITNFVFKLHFRVTFLLLMVFMILVSSREYFGQHISCIADQGVSPNVIQTYCFFTSTFTVVRHFNQTLLEQGVLPHPGVGPMSPDEEIMHHAYYQWVPFVLLGQAISFYLPYYIWKKKEGGRVKALVDGLQLARISLEDQEMVVNGKTVPSKFGLQERLEIIRKDIVLRLRVTRTWSTWLVLMEIANLANVMLQIYFTNRFLNGLFIALGPQLFNVDWNGAMDPLDTVFPKVTKCVFHKYGPSGSIQQHDALCVMALNVINEKIFSMLWFWYLFLFIVSVLAVLWRLATYLLHRRSLKFNQMVFHTNSPGKINAFNIVMITRGCIFADWLFLHYLASNMDGFVFKELFSRLAEELEKLEIPEDNSQKGDSEKGDVPVLVTHKPLLDIDDETLPFKVDYSKSKDS